MPQGTPAQLVYDAHDERTNRHALVFQSEAIPHLQFNARFYERNELDHARRFAVEDQAKEAADEWCNYAR